jgi:radical SAM protein with 4Fe4S-binding SPASM domain
MKIRKTISGRIRNSHQLAFAKRFGGAEPSAFSPMKTLAQQVNIRASRNNIPLSMVIELTYRCNLRCYYCYQKKFLRQKELSKKKWRSILKQLADSGTLYLTFSGGEPFVRSDFLDIVEIARKFDFGVSIISNGTLMTAEIVRRLAGLGIMDIGISFHAARPALHDRLAGKKGSFMKARKSLVLCQAAGIRTMIKHSVSSENFGEFMVLQRMADEAGSLFECDCFVLPHETGTVSPFSLSKDQYGSFLKKIKADVFSCTSKRDINARLHCDAGRSTAGISPSGDVVACIQLPIVFGNIKKCSFSSVWNSLQARRFRVQEKKLSSSCTSCSIKQFCSRCHGIAYLESGNWQGKTPCLCTHALAVKKSSGY